MQADMRALPAAYHDHMADVVATMGRVMNGTENNNEDEEMRDEEEEQEASEWYNNKARGGA